MNQGRKALNWQAICAGRDLLKEIQLLEKYGRDRFEKVFRKQIALEIMNPTEIRIKTGCAGDSLD